MEKDYKKFLRGFVAGSVAAGAFAWWWNSGFGIQARERMNEYVEDLKDYMRPKIRRLKKMGVQKIDEFLGQE